ncbi:MAG: hypothetical protein KGJ23_09630 [Euryarchaeota archaeon]|nr:hypothetical protein [Euryarchaeota archaeon]MDE1836862.1 hypothetical protein [Euryarchaeota archaeon]MDE2046036.1 hypothetical protein [Thermoplasmata archaeon]
MSEEERADLPGSPEAAPSGAPGERPEVAPAVKKGEERPSASPEETRRQRSHLYLLLLIFVLVSQPLLLLVVLVPAWWAALPILSIWGVVGWKRSRLWALLVGFVLGFGYWGVQLLLLPVGPRDKLAAIIASNLGGSTTVAFLVGPLLLGVLSALGSLTVAGGLRFWDEIRPLPLVAPVEKV